MESYKVKIAGRKPLLLHNASQLGATGGRRERIPSPETEAEAGLYKDESGAIGIPALNIKATFREAAKQFKVPGRGKATFKSLIQSGIEIEPSLVPLTPNKWVIDTRPAVVQRARIMRSRPRFDKWELEFIVTIVDALIVPQNLKDIIEAGGRFVGLCDFRPEFGLFTLESFEKC